MKGLLPTTKDKRDYSHHKNFGTLGASLLPTTDFLVAPISYINNQESLDFCVGEASSEMNGDLFEQRFDPLYQFAKTKETTGDWKSYGAQLRDGCKSLITYGSLPDTDAPFTADQPRDFLANWNNYPSRLDAIAQAFKSGSYFIVDGSGDLFDNIRSTLWLHREDRESVLIGVDWMEEWTNASGGIVSSVGSNSIGGHALRACGQKIINGEPYLVVPNSWGKNAGNGGVYYLSRQVINAQSAYGAFYLSLETPTELQRTLINYLGELESLLKKLIAKYI